MKLSNLFWFHFAGIAKRSRQLQGSNRSVGWPGESYHQYYISAPRWNTSDSAWGGLDISAHALRWRVETTGNEKCHVGDDRVADGKIQETGAEYFNFPGKDGEEVRQTRTRGGRHWYHQTSNIRSQGKIWRPLSRYVHDINIAWLFGHLRKPEVELLSVGHAFLANVLKVWPQFEDIALFLSHNKLIDVMWRLQSWWERTRSTNQR